MADGNGCMCRARSEHECGCPDVDWTPQETINLQAINAELLLACEVALSNIATHENINGVGNHPMTASEVILRNAVKIAKGES